MGHWITLDSHDDHIRAWRADPAIPPHGALVVVQEIFGVNSHIRDVVDKFAAHGYIAIAPCLFDHIERGVELGYDAAGVASGRELVAALGIDVALADIHVATEHVAAEAHVGVVGYCWGGTVAYLACTRLGLPAVSYYGGRTVPFLHERPQAPLMLHFGESDPIIPPADVQKHRDALPMAEIHVWPAGHGFNCDQRGDYDAAVAEQALARTLAFFGEHLR
jgi:carboxymethylenebutenolidase